MNWRALFAVIVSLALALQFVPAFSQAAPGSSSSGVASVSLSHSYTITSYGFGVLNENFTFKNNGSSAMQIPSLQVGLPQNISSKVTGGFIVSPSSQFSLSQSSSNGATILTISANQPTLSGGSSTTVALEAYLTNILNFSTSTGFTTHAPALILLSPSLNVNVTKMTTSLVLPASGSFSPTPAGFTAPASSAASTAVYTKNSTGFRPQAVVSNLNFTVSSHNAFTPLSVYSLVRTVVSAANGAPMVQDQFSIHNLASYSITGIQLHLLRSGVGTVTVIPNTEPPLLNPQPISVTNGQLNFQSTSLGAPLLAGSNLTFTVSYPAPASAIAVSGTAVKVTIPYTPFITALVDDYVIQLAPTKGVIPSGPTRVENRTVTPFASGNVVFNYSVNVGWAADQAVPAGVLIFAVAFAMFVVQRPSVKEKGEEEEKESLETADVLKVFEEKTGLETQFIAELARGSKGSIGRNEFDRMRNEVNELRGRALQRLAELKRDVGAGRQFDLLTQVGEAEKAEDRAFRDLLNLYLQYHGSRMNEQTFRRLQSSYRRRVESAINHLSDLLHEVRTEEK